MATRLLFEMKRNSGLFTQNNMRSLALVLIALSFSMTGWSADLARYAVILSDPPAIGPRAQTPRAGIEAAAARVLAAQEGVRRELRTRGIRVTGASHTLLNAIYVEAESAEADQLK